MEHPKREQNPKFTPLSETTSIPICFIYESPSGPVTPLLQAFFNQTTHNRWRKCHDDILAIVKKSFFLHFFLNQSIDEIITTFATCHPRHLLLKDILKDEQ